VSVHGWNHRPSQSWHHSAHGKEVDLSAITPGTTQRHSTCYCSAYSWFAVQASMRKLSSDVERTNLSADPFHCRPAQSKAYSWRCIHGPQRQ
jgi:hypothetical protein